jgi:hypothetical protein
MTDTPTEPESPEPEEEEAAEAPSQLVVPPVEAAPIPDPKDYPGEAGDRQ